MGFCQAYATLEHMTVNRAREIKERLKMILFPKCSLSWDCAFEFACITAVVSRRLQTEAERTPGLSKAKSTTTFMQWWLWQAEPLIPDHRLHSSTVTNQNREWFWPSSGSKSARVRNPHWPRCRHTWVSTERKGGESWQPTAASSAPAEAQLLGPQHQLQRWVYES